MLSAKEITKMCKGTKITSRVDWYKTTKSESKSNQQHEYRGAVLRNFATCEILQVANFRNPAKFLLPSFSFAFLIQISSDSICIFEFGSGSSCLNWIEDNEVFGLQNY